ncbi:MAG: VOC family protein [Chloroflexi bacterium]|nr:VOC family protein [Chloroflexota bacterium]MCY3588266.1 VOC family protein [Chloroflexota bacterium]MCY3684915.1 VOC family protein [Chloroflexota bacterium]MDE2707569.1 VOC family protein [Chloroflexota bacterium]
MQKITPYLWYDHDAQAAVDLYVSLFPNSRVISVERIPSGPGEDGAIVEFELDGQRMTAFDGGPMFRFTGAVSFVVSCETQEEIDHYWYGLSAGGEEQQCGWLKDPYGLSWQIVPAALAELIAAAPQAVMDALFQMGKIEIEPLRRAANESAP